jgi:5-methylcytosine-specific restriction enzyme A
MLTDRPPRPCLEPGCPEFGTARYCQKHKRSGIGRHDRHRDWNKWYSTAGWKRLRLYVLHREPICRDPFGLGCRNPSTVVDHVRDHRGDLQMFFDVKNLRGLCSACHDRKTGESVGAGRAVPKE